MHVSHKSLYLDIDTYMYENMDIHMCICIYICIWIWICTNYMSRCLHLVFSLMYVVTRCEIIWAYMQD